MGGGFFFVLQPITFSPYFRRQSAIINACFCLELILFVLTHGEYRSGKYIYGISERIMS